MHNKWCVSWVALYKQKDCMCLSVAFTCSWKCISNRKCTALYFQLKPYIHRSISTGPRFIFVFEKMAFKWLGSWWWHQALMTQQKGVERCTSCLPQKAVLQLYPGSNRQILIKFTAVQSSLKHHHMRGTDPWMFSKANLSKYKKQHLEWDRCTVIWDGKL